MGPLSIKLPDWSLWEMLFGNWRKQATFRRKWHLRNECRNSILMTCHYPGLGSTFDWLKQISHVAQLIRGTTQIWIRMHHQYGISVLISQMSFRRETRSGAPKCQLFSWASCLGVSESYFFLSVCRGKIHTRMVCFITKNDFVLFRRKAANWSADLIYQQILCLCSIFIEQETR